MGYRALFVADIHVGNSLPWAVKDPETMITDRALDIMSVLDQMMEYALDKELTDIWIVGDLIDKRLVDAVTLKLVTAQLIRLKDVGLTVRLIPGNHEAGDAAGRNFTLDAFAAMGFWVAGISDVVHSQISLIEPVSGFSVVAMPYLPPNRFHELIESQSPDVMNSTLALIHQTIKGAMVGGWTSPAGIDPEQLESIAMHTLAGHFHTKQDVTKHVHYLGAPVQHVFSDSGEERGFWDVDWMGKLCRRKLIPIRDAPTFHEHLWRTDGADSTELPSLDSIQLKSYVNLKVIGSRSSVDKLWIDAERWCSEARDRGARLARPVASIVAGSGRQRMSLGTGEERPGWDALLSRYLDTADCTGLNRTALEQLGNELMQAADK